MCPPIWTENNAWLDPQYQWAKDFLRRKVPSPMIMALQGEYAGLENRMLMIGGAQDTTCPPNINSDKFAKLVGCKSIVMPGYAHNVWMSGEARGKALEFIGKP
jgi:pimeloyl-ACP methyl ester carboxylesterase